ncbi:hypothetical protein SK128_015336 [Halocaridina rubra]|uniref:MADF domain-containing protein n=1 Tax=Halocaridina rubra TaxID=373956 RepID=A0AAN8WZ01_HALRR
MNAELEAEKTDFDTEYFIAEIQSRPAVWDLNDDDYCNREVRRKCWEELVTIFFKNEEASAAEKNECGKLLQRKWKSLRDCYTRERQRLAKIKSGSSVARKTQYVYYNRLSFLQRVIKGRDTSNNMEEAAAEERPSDSEQPSTTSTVQHVEAGKGKRKRVDDISSEVQCLVNVLQAGMQSREEREKRNEEDEDRLFLLSLLTPMKRIPEHLRFGVRMEIMQVIQNATESGLGIKVEYPS